MALESVAVDLRFLCFLAPGSFQPGTSALGLGAEVGIDGFSLYWYAVGVQVSKWCTGGFSVFVWPILQWYGFKDTLEAHSLDLLAI